MTFRNPQYLAALTLALIIVGLWARGRRQYIVLPSREQAVRSSLLSRMVVRMPFFCWFAVSLLLIISLADPLTTQRSSFVTLHSKKSVVSVDASASMGEGDRGSTMDRIKAMLHEFADRRIDKGDFIGISAYSGQEYEKRGTGYARIIQYPTEDRQVVHEAIKVLRPSMFGHYTAIGDGILMSTVALIEPEARAALGERFSRKKLEDSLWSIGTRHEDVSYAQTVAEAVGRQKGSYVVLFTDGKFNTGIHPGSALWFARRIGLTVHFIAFESSAATGLSKEDQEKRKAETVEAVVRTGGIYRESSDVEGVAYLLREIDDIENAEITVEQQPKTESRRKAFTLGAAAIFGLWMICWASWSDPL